jgi:rhodanese-related sulfurtransferase
MIILDVREKEEYLAQRVPHSISCPLSQFDYLAPGILQNIPDSDITIMCLTGKRSVMALEELKKIDLNRHRFHVYEGGIKKWQEAGHEVIGENVVFPILRQVQIVASTMIFIAFILSFTVSFNFIYLALMVGGGLALSGWTGICPMVYILQKMPWNKAKKRDGSLETKNCCS